MSKEDFEKHFVAQIAQKALLEQDGKILLVKYPEDDWLKGKWDLPGGRLHEGETAHVGVLREVKEEIGTDIITKEVLATGVKVVNESFKLYWVIYRAQLANPHAKLVPEAGEIERAEWRKKEEFFTLPLINPDYAEALKSVLV
jgi:8-oxo-dGTP diphosphatase